MSRVFVTGLGVVSPLGNSVKSLWSKLIHGASGIRLLTRIDTGDLPCRIGGEVDGFDQPRLPLRERACWRKMDRASRFIVDATAQAIRHAKISAEEYSKAAVIIGSGLSGLETLQEQTRILLERGARRVSPHTIPMIMPNAAAANVSLAFGMQGPCWTVNAACASSSMALHEAAEGIRNGRFGRVLVGGTEASLTRLGIASFCQMGAMTRSSNENPAQAMKPFDRDRDGMVMSEGAAALLLESEDSVSERGVNVLAELSGWSAISDACHLVAPARSAEGLIQTMQDSLLAADLAPDRVASRLYVNAHGTATSLNDETETVALRKVFLSSAKQLQVSSTKSMTGHMIGASGAVEAIACIMALRSGQLPPTLNLKNPSPECDLDYIPRVSRTCEIDAALSTSMGFGGHNVSLVFTKCDD